MADARDRTPIEDDFQWPEVKDMIPADALELMDRLDSEAREANRVAERAKQRKKKSKLIAMQVLEANRLPGADIRDERGQRISFTIYPFRAYRVVDQEAFNKWEALQDENYYDPTPKLREEVLLGECRRRFDDQEELPPGVQEYTEERLSRTAVKG